MFNWTIYYHHTFLADVVKAWTKKQAKQKALSILEKEFKDTALPFNVSNCGHIISINRLEDLIEDICFGG